MKKNKKLTTPILFLIFNRPDTTQKVFNEIRKVKPSQLFVAADGPRDNVQGEKEKCQKAREIIKQVDWDCDVRTLFRDKNLGCKYAVSSAIDWFFNNVEEGIILEDDCLPSQSFFWFCQELLEKYRDDERIMHIGGYKESGQNQDSHESYFFSRITHVWGWASWRRFWKFYDVNIMKFPQLKEKLKDYNFFITEEEIKPRLRILNEVYSGKINSWGYQLNFTMRINGGLSIVPNINLVKNIGFGKDATHTHSSFRSSFINEKREIDFPLIHPEFIMENKNYDIKFIRKNIMKRPSLIRLFKRAIKKYIYYVKKR